MLEGIQTSWVWIFFLPCISLKLLWKCKQTLVSSEESHHPPALDEVQMCYLSHILHFNLFSFRRIFSVVSQRDKVRKESGKKLNWEELMRHCLILQYHLSSANNNFPIFQHKEWHHTAFSGETSVFCNRQSKFNQAVLHSNWAFICCFIWAKSSLKNFKVTNQPNPSPLSKHLGSIASDTPLFSLFSPVFSETSFSQSRKVYHKNKDIKCIRSVWIQVWQQYCLLFWFFSC